MEKSMDEMRRQNDQAQVLQVRERQQLRALQEQLGSKVGELYELNDKLADLLHIQSHS